MSAFIVGKAHITAMLDAAHGTEFRPFTYYFGPHETREWALASHELSGDEMHVSTPSSPAVFRVGSYVHVVMPMSVRWEDGNKPQQKPAPPVAASPNPSTRGRRTVRRPTSVRKEPHVKKEPRLNFYRRQAAFAALGIEPDKRSWKELRPLIKAADSEAQGAFDKLLAKLRGLSGNDVAGVVNDGPKPEPEPAPAASKRSKPRKRGKPAERTDAGDAEVEGAPADAKANAQKAA